MAPASEGGLGWVLMGTNADSLPLEAYLVVCFGVCFFVVRVAVLSNHP